MNDDAPFMENGPLLVVIGSLSCQFAEVVGEQPSFSLYPTK
jgi:hypothetical protein